MMYECRACHEVKPPDAFGIRSGTDRRKTRCLVCDAAWHRQHYAENSAEKLEKAEKYYRENKEQRRAYLATRVEKDRAWNRDYKLRQNYGISYDLFCETIEYQHYHCPICREHFPSIGKHWHTDHCHRTGHVRGVICSSCNLLLGHAKDSIEVLENAIEYLRSHYANHNNAA